jgi:hypothetical protein
MTGPSAPDTPAQAPEPNPQVSAVSTSGGGPLEGLSRGAPGRAAPGTVEDFSLDKCPDRDVTVIRT